MASAIAAAEDGDTIKLTADIPLAETLTIDADKDITIDLNGNDLTITLSTGSYGLIVRGDLTINDSVETGTVSIDGVPANGGGIGVTGNLTVNGGTFTSDDSQIHLFVSSEGNIIINDGSFTAKYSCVTNINTNGTVTITGGNFTLSDDAGLLFIGDVDVSGGTFNVNPVSATIADGKTVTESNGIYTVA